jgi:hypothetical protein
LVVLEDYVVEEGFAIIYLLFADHIESHTIFCRKDFTSDCNSEHADSMIPSAVDSIGAIAFWALGPGNC